MTSGAAASQVRRQLGEQLHSPFFKSARIKDVCSKRNIVHSCSDCCCTVVYRVFFRPTSIKWEKRGGENMYAPTHTHTHTHNTTTSQVFLFFLEEKRRGRVGGEAMSDGVTLPQESGVLGFFYFFFLVLASIHDNSCLDGACIWRGSCQLVGTMFELVH